MQYIIGLNGPPKVGKDTIATALVELMDTCCLIPTHVDHLARPMREMAMSLCGIDPKDFARYNEIKDEPQSLLKRAAKLCDPDTIRQLMIATSEDFIKPRYGQDFWGRKLLVDHSHWLAAGLPGVLIVPDIGFPDEVSVFDSMFPGVQTLIVQVDRPGTTWVGDSRFPCEGQRNTCHLFNDKTPDWAAAWLLGHIQHVLGWNLDCQG